MINVEFGSFLDEENDKATELVIISEPHTNDNVVVRFETTSNGTTVVIERENGNGVFTIGSFHGDSWASLKKGKA